MIKQSRNKSVNTATSKNWFGKINNHWHKWWNKPPLVILKRLFSVSLLSIGIAFLFWWFPSPNQPHANVKLYLAIADKDFELKNGKSYNIDLIREKLDVISSNELCFVIQNNGKKTAKDVDLFIQTQTSNVFELAGPYREFLGAGAIEFSGVEFKKDSIRNKSSSPIKKIAPKGEAPIYIKLSNPNLNLRNEFGDSLIIRKDRLFVTLSVEDRETVMFTLSVSMFAGISYEDYLIYAGLHSGNLKEYFKNKDFIQYFSKGTKFCRNVVNGKFDKLTKED
jgi:hypothetical protein